jgi:hypothetical protein
MNDRSVASAAREALPSDLAAFLDEVKVERRGRLIFGLDATGSRRPTWDMAASLTAGMFREAGGLDLQLIYYRGEQECRTSGWVGDADRLVKLMARIECEAGVTQLGRILEHAQKEAGKRRVDALVFVGDALEENPDALIAKACELGKLGLPVFMFQEGDDPDVERAFQSIAKVTGGVYARFEPGAAKHLSDLLKAVSLFVVGGMAALEGRKDAGSALLIEQLKRANQTGI